MHSAIPFVLHGLPARVSDAPAKKTPQFAHTHPRCFSIAPRKSPRKASATVREPVTHQKNHPHAPHLEPRRHLPIIPSYNMTSAQIRRQFIDFFVQKHGHTFVPSSPVVPLDDPTLLFTNAGMNQFKPIFLGQEKRAYTRAANTQKCIRAGGKHNDLDDVGRSRRHHTFFEMLGNWSFGDYFKQGAIEMAWELLTQVWKLDPTRLHVSCFEGNPAAGIPRDTEAADIWKKSPASPMTTSTTLARINSGRWATPALAAHAPKSSSIAHPTRPAAPKSTAPDPRVMEIWNLVFIQYNRDATGKLTPLPAQHVDTGMGFERICQVIQSARTTTTAPICSPRSSTP